MTSLTSLLAACALYGVVATTAVAATDCEQLVPPMQALHADIRAGVSMTDDQQALWRRWNQDCRAPMWNVALRSITALPTPPVSPPVRAVREEEPEKGMSLWSALAIGFLQGMDRGLSRSICTTQWWGSGTRGKYVTMCY